MDSLGSIKIWWRLQVRFFIETLRMQQEASLVVDTDKRNKSDKNSYETRHQHAKPELIIEWQEQKKEDGNSGC